MGLPTLENGPYVFNVNNLYTASSDTDKYEKFWFAIKEELVALGGAGVIWQVVASSDASSVKNIGDASPDLWTVQGDVNFSTGAHSWCVLENQTTGAQLSIQLNYTSGTQGRVRFSPGGTYSTDGTTSALPTSTDSQYLALSTCVLSTSSGREKFVVNIMTSADHKILRFYIHERQSTDGAAGGQFWGVELVANAPSLWTSTDKYAVWYNSLSTSVSTLAYDKSPRIEDFDGNGGINCYVETAAPYTGWNSKWITTECYKNIGGAPSVPDSPDGSPLWSYDGICGLNGGYPICPIGLYDEAVGEHGGSWGRLTDIYYASRLHQTFDTYPSDGSRQWIKFGGFLVPWNGTAPVDAA
jgi:hypothetical protein